MNEQEVRVPRPPVRRGLIIPVDTPVAPPPLPAAAPPFVQTELAISHEPPAPAPRRQVANNMATPNNGLVDLNFKVAPNLHQKFKIEATMRRMSMKDLLEASFKCYLERFPL